VAVVDMVERLIKALVARDDGQDLAEYGIALAVITVAVALFATALGTDVTTLWSSAEPALETVIDATP
jgi:Flp pilus assembly pilin Flp